MNTQRSFAVLFQLLISLFLTTAVLALMNAISPEEGSHWTDAFLKRGAAPMLSLFFGIYCAALIRYLAGRVSSLMPYLKLLLLFCLFPAGIGLAGTLMVQRDFEEKARLVLRDTPEAQTAQVQEQIERERAKIRQPMLLGGFITLADGLFLGLMLRRTAKREDPVQPSS